MPWASGGMTNRDRRRQWLAKMKATIVAQVWREQRTLNFSEAYRRWRPNATPGMVRANAVRDMGNEMVMTELDRLLHIKDKDLLKKVKPEVIVQDLLEDLRVLNDLRDLHKQSPEAIVKILLAKAPKQKMLGQAIALWKAERPEDRAEDAGKLMAALRGIHSKGSEN